MSEIGNLSPVDFETSVWDGGQSGEIRRPIPYGRYLPRGFTSCSTRNDTRLTA